MKKFNIKGTIEMGMFSLIVGLVVLLIGIGAQYDIFLSQLLVILIAVGLIVYGCAVIKQEKDEFDKKRRK